MEKIIIVESPTKCKTIESYMGSDYKVVSSKGHIRDLSVKGAGGLGVNIENNFEPYYEILSDKKNLVADLKKICEGKEVYLATDPDREGEAISWHLAQVLGLDVEKTNRIEFHEITKKAILEAFKNPRHIDMNLFYSQETRRIIDRILGFKLSKLLKSKIKAESAGRVQSVALRMIYELEDKINKFVPTSYYEIWADVSKNKFQLTEYLGKKVSKIKDEVMSKEIYDSLGDTFIVEGITESEAKTLPKAPFTTSTLEQEASIKYNFSASKTMKIAQALYEGKNLGNGHAGLITYMRTDSTRLSDQFVFEARDYITKNYGKEYLGFYNRKVSENAQDAHEAIRPTSIIRTPDSVKTYLTNDELKIYTLIYNKALASLMAPAVYAKTDIKLSNNGAIFESTLKKNIFDGFQIITSIDKASHSFKYNVSEEVKSDNIELKALETKPDSHYTEASLIKDMEELGIGRPSTYSQTLESLVHHGYVTIEKKNILITETGILASGKLNEFFSSFINVKYTAGMEASLDLIATGKGKEIDELNKFYFKDFLPLYENAYENMEKLAPKLAGKKCPECGADLVEKNSAKGKFLACINFPKCHYTETIIPSVPGYDEHITCPKCGEGRLVPHINFKGKGKFYFSCSNYPKCNTVFYDIPTDKICPTCGSIMLLDPKGKAYCSANCQKKTATAKENDTGIICPKCGIGHIVKRIALKGSNKGKAFYACSNYPKCKNIYTFEPTNNKCQKCGDLLVETKKGLVCPNCETKK